jgi:hypothetical protein
VKRPQGRNVPTEFKEQQEASVKGAEEMKRTEAEGDRGARAQQGLCGSVLGLCSLCE